jgi:hypothetical protein
VTSLGYLYLPLAHGEDWYWLLRFMLPAILVVGGVIRTVVRERRKAREGDDSSGGG